MLCYRQVASIFTFISDNFVKLLFLNCLHSIEKKKLQMKIVVPKLQETILYGTRIDVQLEHCIVPNVTIFPQNHKRISITILLRSTAPQNLMSLSSVNFVIKSFQDITLDVNIETLNTEAKSDQEQKMCMWNTWWEMLRITGWQRSCHFVNHFWWIPNLKGRGTKCSLTQWKLSTKQSWTKKLIVFWTIWNVQQKWMWLSVSFWKI